MEPTENTPALAVQRHSARGGYRPRMSQRSTPRRNARHAQPSPSTSQLQMEPSMPPAATVEAGPNANTFALGLRPASVPPATRSSEPTTTTAEMSSSGHSVPAVSRGGGRGNRPQKTTSTGSRSRGRRGGIGLDRPQGSTSGPQSLVTTMNGRQFGGHLTAVAITTDELSVSSTSKALSGGAPVFHPAQAAPLAQRGGKSIQGEASKRRPPGSVPQRRASKSSAADIATRTHEDIASGNYECPICTNEVGRNSKVWSCRECWSVFHIGCIKKWSRNEGSAQNQQVRDGELPKPRMWRCPGCNLPREEMPNNYTCWCQKEIDPRSVHGLPPHSCGQSCGRPRELPRKCPHPCELICHAGPCPPCTHAGPTQACYCGQKLATRRCVDTDYDHAWSCGGICGDALSCGEHLCTSACHEGLCGACRVEVTARCYCGQSRKQMRCSEKETDLSSARLQETKIIDEWIGTFSCQAQCGRPLDCGYHSCQKSCHAQEVEPGRCPLSPATIAHCPCGKTPLKDILEEPRKSCQEPIPHCTKRCLKTLQCSHTCQQSCHSGDCAPCMETIELMCRCGRVSSSSICHQGSTETPMCFRTCRATLNCGRHECGERCCTGERRAIERNANKRKQWRLDSPPRIMSDFEAEHICTRVCNRQLKCGNHSCQELCHKGPCGSCREAIFNDISCECGRTVLQPPLPCGTTPPTCQFDCDRPKSCGHPQVSHNCHGNDEKCPRCPFLVRRACMCRKNILKNQQCWLTDVRCGELCGKLLRCGAHHCQNQCHRPGYCEDASQPCQQRCGKAKKSCGHSCNDNCHAPYPCREETPCKEKSLITCQCQRRKQEVRCNASRTAAGNHGSSLECDDECGRLERNRKLALALELDPDTHHDDHVPYSSETLDMFTDTFKEDRKWTQEQERSLRAFAVDEAERRLRFKPMSSQRRSFVHSLAEDFGFDHQSMDTEPHRHVAILKTPRFIMAPRKTLAQCVDITTAMKK